MSVLTFQCSTCDQDANFNTSKNVTSRGKSCEINRWIVYSSIEMGCGYEGISNRKLFGVEWHLLCVSSILVLAAEKE